MNRKSNLLLYMLIATALMVCGLGAYLKYEILAPVALYQEESIIAVPFLLLSDEEAKYLLRADSTQDVQNEAPVQEELPIEPTPSPEPIPVDESWFDDVLFVGDSRTQGLGTYGRLGQAEYFCDVGLSVYSIQSTRIGMRQVGKVSLETLLTKKSYGKIYICLGLNEIMSSHDKLIAQYQEVIDMIREKQPDAVIVLQAVMTVGRDKAASKECFRVENINSLNQRIKALAVGDNMRYIDVNEWIADEEGYLPDGWSKDGCHPYANGYYEWGQWILENASTLGIA